MVHGAQGTLNHLEPPSESEPLSTAAGDYLDLVDEQQEGEQKAGSGEDGPGKNDHDDEAAVVEGTADAKEIPTHSDGFEDSSQPNEKSILEADPSNLDAEKIPEIVPSEEIDSNTILQEEEQTENQIEDASQPQLDIHLDHESKPSASEDNVSQEGEVKEETAEDQPQKTEEEDQLPVESTDDELKEQVIAESAEADPVQPVDAPDAQGPSATPDHEESSPKSEDPIAEVTELTHDGQDEGSPADLGDFEQKDNELVEPELENPAESEDDHGVSLPAVVDIESPSTPTVLTQSQDEGNPIESEEVPKDVALGVGDPEMESAQVTADEPAIATSAEASDQIPSTDDHVDAEQLQPIDEQEVIPSTNLDKQQGSTQEDETQRAVLDSPGQIEETVQDNETGSVNQDAPEAETASSFPLDTTFEEAQTVTEASEPEANVAEVVEVPEQAISASSADDQETVAHEPSTIDPVASDDLNPKEAIVESENEAAPDPSPVIDEPPRQIEAEVDMAKTASKPSEDVPVPEEHDPEDSAPAIDAQPDPVESEPVDSGEPLTTSEETELTPSEPPSSDHDDSAIDLQPQSDNSKVETESKEELADASIDQAQKDPDQDEGDEQHSEMDFREGKFDPARDSGVVMNRNDDNLSEVTVKIGSTSEGSDTFETDTKDAQGEGQESSEATSAQEQAPEGFENGKSEPAQPVSATDPETTAASPGDKDIVILPQEEVVPQEQEASEQETPAHDDASQGQDSSSDPQPAEGNLGLLPEEAVVSQDQQPTEEPLPAEGDKTLPPEEDVIPEPESAEDSLPAEENKSVPQEETVSQEQQPVEEPLPAGADGSVPPEDVSLDQGAAEDLSLAEQQEAVNQELEPAEGPLPIEDPVQVEDDKSLPQEEEASQGPEPAEEPLPTESLPDSKSDQGDDSHLKEALATGATAALVATAAGVAAHEISSSNEEEAQVTPESSDLVDSERPRTADKSTGPDETATPIEPAKDEVAAPEPVPDSAIAAEAPIFQDSQQEDGDFKPRASRRDSSTQTEELWRPKTPFMRSVTPAIVLPDADDSEAKTRSRARVSRTDSQRSIQHAEEIVAAAVIIRAAADTLGETSTRMTDAVKELKQHENNDDALDVKDGRRGTGDAARSLRDSSANRLTGVDRTSKTDDKSRSPRQHRSSHGSRSSRPSTRESGSKRHSTHRHRHEGDREVEQGSPQTPPRTRDTADTGHRSRRERTPQEQADHEKRKEERRLAREKAKTDSPATESKGKEVETSPSIDRRSSRRHSSSKKETVPSIASTSRTESTAPPQASKKFFDKNGVSVVETFGGPLTAETSKDGSLKRSGSKSVRRSLSQNQAKLQKARVEESVKATKDKASKERPRESRTTSAASNGNSSTKDRDDKHRKSRMEKREKEEAASSHKEEKKEKKTGGLKGMFKKMFG